MKSTPSKELLCRKEFSSNYAENTPHTGIRDSISIFIQISSINCSSVSKVSNPGVCSGSHMYVILENLH